MAFFVTCRVVLVSIWLTSPFGKIFVFSCLEINK